MINIKHETYNKKQWYLLYPLVLLHPCVHEIGHLIILRWFNIPVTALHWNYITWTKPSCDLVYRQVLYLHNCWEYSTWIPFIFLGLFIICVLWDKIKEK